MPSIFDSFYFKAQDGLTTLEKTASDALNSVSGLGTNIVQKGIGTVGNQLGGLLDTTVDGILTQGNVIKDTIQSNVSGLTDKVASIFADEKSVLLDTIKENKASAVAPTNAVSPEETMAPKHNNKGVNKFPSDLNDDFSITFKFTRYEKNSKTTAPRSAEVYTVVFPLPTNLRDTTKLDYKSFNIGPMGGLIEQGFETVQKGGGRGNLSKLMQDAVTRFPEIAYYQSRNTLGVIGSEIETIAGAVVNPQESMFFNTVNLRAFDFTFRFSPKNPKEVGMLKEILRNIKGRSLPHSKDGFGGQSRAILGYPDNVDIELRPNVHPIKKKCFVTGLAYNYAPEGLVFFNDKEKYPSIIDVTISITETAIFTREDITEDLNDKNFWANKVVNAKLDPAQIKSQNDRELSRLPVMSLSASIRKAAQAAPSALEASQRARNALLVSGAQAVDESNAASIKRWLSTTN